MKRIGKPTKLFWEDLRLKIEDKPEKPPVLISINGKRFSTEGNISMITGKAKSKKTFLNTAIAAAAISDKEILGFSNKGKKQKVLYFDTEQSSYDCWNVLDRIYKLSGTSNTEDLYYFPLKTFSPSDRLEIVGEIINDINFKDFNYIIIDGVRDLLKDFNSTEESFEVVTKLMKWTEELNKHILTVLHQNKANEFARGHLGSELTNKCETTVSVNKESDSYVSTVNAEYIRGESFEPFSFKINNEGIPVACDRPIKKSKQKINPEDFDIKQHLRILKEIYDSETQFSKNDLKMKIIKTWKEKFNFSFGDNVSRKFVDHLLYEEVLTDKGTSSRSSLCINDKYLTDGKIDFSV